MRSSFTVGSSVVACALVLGGCAVGHVTELPHDRPEAPSVTPTPTAAPSASAAPTPTPTGVVTPTNPPPGPTPTPTVDALVAYLKTL